MGLYIIHELSYDRFNKNADRIVRVTMEYGQAGDVRKMAVTGTKVGPQFDRTFPQVQSFVRVYNRKDVVRYQTKMFNEGHILYADSTFFKIFSFHLLQGNPNTILTAPGSIVLTKSTATKYFGNVNPVGKRLQIGADKVDYTVTGVAADPPTASQIKFDFVASFNSLDFAKKEQWWEANYITYLLLQNQNQIVPLQHQITTYMKGVCKNELHMTGSRYLTYHLEPLTRVHLYSQLDGGLEPNGSITTVYILGIIALLILIVACINYTNLATAQTIGRSIEIGVRKALGAGRRQLFIQFIGESFLLTIISLLLAVILAIVLLPAFSMVTGKAFTAGMMLRPAFIVVLLSLCLIITFTSGSYPAFILSNMKLAKMLKSGAGFMSSGGSFRKSLIVFQFVASIFLITSTLIIVKQLSYVRHKKLGYNKEHVIVLPVDSRMRKNYVAFKNALKTYPQIIGITGAYDSPTFIRWSDAITADNGSGKVRLNVNALPVDLDFIKTMGMHLVAGSAFTRADLQKMDTTNNYKNLHYTFMLNETAVHDLGWTPQQAIGQTISKGVTGKVKAVVKDFNFSSLHNPIGPLVIFLDQQMVHEMFIRVKGTDIPETLQFLEKKWQNWVPYRPFEYHFLSDSYNNLYITEQRTARVFTIFSTLAIFLACLGLLALAALSIEQRTKEIGIRKVLGSSVTGIVALLSKDFLKLVGVGFLIAAPVAWYAMHRWLENFAYHISIGVWTFLLAGALAMIIALVTVSWQSIRAATANPVDSLHNE